MSNDLFSNSRQEITQAVTACENALPPQDTEAPGLWATTENKARILFGMERPLNIDVSTPIEIFEEKEATALQQADNRLLTTLARAESPQQQMTISSTGSTEGQPQHNIFISTTEGNGTQNLATNLGVIGEENTQALRENLSADPMLNCIVEQLRISLDDKESHSLAPDNAQRQQPPSLSR